jgi:hypothetical protein
MGMKQHGSAGTHLISKINESSIVRENGRLSIAHINQITFVLDINRKYFRETVLKSILGFVGEKMHFTIYINKPKQMHFAIYSNTNGKQNEEFSPLLQLSGL